MNLEEARKKFQESGLAIADGVEAIGKLVSQIEPQRKEAIKDAARDKVADSGVDLDAAREKIAERSDKVRT